MSTKYTRVISVGVALVVCVGGFVAWSSLRPSGYARSIVSGNGRIEATEIDVATKLGGRVQEILVHEGDFVRAGDPLARMQVEVLEAQRDEVRAQHQQALQAVGGVQAQVAARESEKTTAEAVLVQRESEVVAAQSAVSQRESDAVATQAVVRQREAELDAARRRLMRSETLSKEGAASIQELDDDRARVATVEAAVGAANAQLAAAQAAISAARAQVATAQAGVAASRSQVSTAEAMIAAAKAQLVGAESASEATRATIARVEADIRDSTLTSPRDGRVQYRVAQPGEVLPAGGKLLNLVDLGDVYMTFFLPETAAGKVALGGEVRIVLDAAPQYVIPAAVSFVASTAQFTPKTVETASERQKLMFRVKARIDRELLAKHMNSVKTGLPGVAWLNLDPQVSWPAELAVKVPE